MASEINKDEANTQWPAAGGQNDHTPVLLHEVIEYLELNSDSVVVDTTLGGGGHARAVLEQLDDDGVFVGIDQDCDVLSSTQNLLEESKPQATCYWLCDNFRNLNTLVEKLDLDGVDAVLFDLGVSSMQLDDPNYGMSFRYDTSLSMSMNKNTEINAFHVVNEWEQDTLEDILFAFGEERYARRIAGAIAYKREQNPIRTTGELIEIIEHAIPSRYRYGKPHFATRTFQAIRMAVNDELNALTEGLEAALHILNKDGRCLVISFHSVEDRAVKQLFKTYEDEGKIQRITKKPLSPNVEETEENPRSRSAKLRVIEKL